jgi:hypothetical protein
MLSKDKKINNIEKGVKEQQHSARSEGQQREQGYEEQKC